MIKLRKAAVAASVMMLLCACDEGSSARAPSAAPSGESAAPTARAALGDSAPGDEDQAADPAAACAAEGIAYQAHLMVQTAIRKRVRDPNSTDFPLAQLSSTLIGTTPCRWTIAAEGRSRNAFNGWSIIAYSAVAEYSGGYYSVDKISVAER